MDCRKVLEDKEPSGWIVGATEGAYGYPQYIFTETGYMLIKKPDDEPARRNHFFLVDKEGKMRQITKGEEEVTSLDGNRFVAITFTFSFVKYAGVRSELQKCADQSVLIFSAQCYLSGKHAKKTMPLYPTDFVHFADSTGSYHFYHSTLGDY